MRAVLATFREHRNRWPLAAFVVLALTIIAILASSERISLLNDVPVALESSGDGLLVAWLYPGSPLWDAGVRPRDRLLSIDNQLVDITASRQQVRRAERIEVVSATSGAVIAAETREPHTLRDPVIRLAFITIAASFTGVGVLVYLLARPVRPSLALLTFSTLVALVLLASLATPFGVPWALAVVFVAMTGVGFAAVRLFLVFPVDQSRRRIGPWLLRATALAGIAVVSGYVFAVRDPLVYPSVLRGQLLTLVLDLVVAASAGLVAWMNAPDQRSSIALAALGLGGGFAPFLTLSILPFLITGSVLVPPEWTIVGIVLMPASLGALMLRRQFPGMERPVRRSAIAFFVWAAMLMAFGIAARLFDASLPPTLDVVLSPVEPLMLIAVVAALFPRIQGAASHAIEQRLFHDVYDFGPTVHSLTADMNRLRGVAAISDATLHALVETLDLTWACLVLPGPNQTETYPRGIAPAGDLVPNQSEILSAAAKIVKLITEENVNVGLLAVGAKRHDLDLSSEDERLLETIGSALAPALRNALLLGELADRVEMLANREQELAALSLRVMRVQEEERRRLATDLHDEPLQHAIFLLRDISDSVSNVSQPTSVQVRRWMESVNDLVVSLRAISAGLRPPTMDDFGLGTALETLVATVRARVDHVEIVYDVADTLLDLRLPVDLEMALYRAAQEGISNSLKHAAPRYIRVALQQHESGLELTVQDDGSAADGSRERLPLEFVSGGYGLSGIRQRLVPWNGTVNLESTPAGKTLRVFVPLDIPSNAGQEFN